MQGQDRVIQWSGRHWTVKLAQNEPIAPGPNRYSDSQQSVWVDQQGLHLKIRRINGVWHSAQVSLNESLGYGMYICYCTSRVDLLDPNVVLQFYTHDPTAQQANHRQIDIQISRWGNHINIQNAQFAIQPSQIEGNSSIFPLSLNGFFSSHIIDWTPQRVRFDMLHDHFDRPPQTFFRIREWLYANQFIQNGNENFRISLWQNNNQGPSNEQEVEVVIRSFNFIPAN